MSSFRQFDAFAAEMTVRLDGMLQAGPDPASKADLKDSVTYALFDKLGKAAR
jgi:hypothetical protein